MKYSIFVFLIFSFFGCQIENDSVISPNIPTAIEISDLNISPNEINTDTIFVNGTKSLADIISLDIKLTFKISKIIESKDLSAIIFKNSEDNIFASSNDFEITPSQNGTYLVSSKINLKFVRSIVGKFYLNLKSINKNISTNSFLLPIEIKRNNSAPFLSNAILPDSVKLSSEVQIIPIYVTANDSNGISDIASVKINSYRLPDIITIRGTFDLYDDGGANKISGNIDKFPGDGIFSLAIQLPPSTIKAKYRFEFIAVDKSNAASIPLLKEIVIY